MRNWGVTHSTQSKWGGKQSSIKRLRQEIVEEGKRAGEQNGGVLKKRRYFLYGGKVTRRVLFSEIDSNSLFTGEPQIRKLQHYQFTHTKRKHCISRRGGKRETSIERGREGGLFFTLPYSPSSDRGNRGRAGRVLNSRWSERV